MPLQTSGHALVSTGLEPDLLELMLDEVQLEPRTGSNAASDAVYGAAVTVQCRIEHNTRLIRGMDGQEVVSSVQVTLATPSLVVGMKDRLTLPDGSQPVLLRVASAKDDRGDYYLELFA